MKLEKIRISAANLGENNPLPDMKNNTYIHAPIRTTDRIRPDELPYLGKGMVPTMLPYLTQDGYDRDKQVRELPVIVLENEFLRAEFYPHLGGRLRRLFDKEAGRELLYVNPVFQPCNLALRNAWFSGGVEFNVGIKGHTPLTCSPVFAQRRVDAAGQEYVSFYDYERIRGVVWSVNACLPQGARTLTIKCCIENKSDATVPMYWWSNIAVEETPGMRVVVPAHHAFVNHFGNDSYVLDKAPMPHHMDTDASYPGNLNRSLDFFYDIPEAQEKWIAAVDASGYGLVQSSDRRLLGRKLFVWGMGQGGRHWAEYLSEPGSGYVEIQAGLAHTQLEHFPMEGNSRLEWTEHYGPVSCDPGLVHGDWNTAIQTVEQELAKLSKPEMPDLSNPKERETLFTGSGWGNVEQKIRGEAISDYFEDWQTADPETGDFEALLDTGKLPAHDPLDAPRGYAVGRFWEEKLKAAGDDWYTHLLHGVALYEQRCQGAAEDACLEAWEKSLEAAENPWACRNLAAFYANEKRDYAPAARLSVKALLMKPDDRALALDCAQLLFAGERCREAGEAVASLPAENGYQVWVNLQDKLRVTAGRLRFLTALALLKLDRGDEAEQILDDRFVMPDIKEGEISISSLWFEIQAKKHGITPEEAQKRFVLPYHLDFRMH